MRILVTGANGFLGQKIVASLLEEQHTVIACVRQVEETEFRFPDIEVITCDFNRDLHYEVWLPRLTNIDVVINCVGILQERRDEIIQAIHTLTPMALFKACQMVGIKKVIQISAYEAEEEAVTDYGRTKHAADKFLKTLDLDWVILKPSLAYSNGSYGGTSLFRAMAALPFVIPLPAGGEQQMQPFFLNDLTKGIAKLVSDDRVSKKEFNIVGPEVFTLRDIILKLRAWLGFKEARVWAIPNFIVRICGFIADFFSKGPLCSNSIDMLTATKPVDDQNFWQFCEIKPLTMNEALQYNPSNVQDRWHARLYFINPLLRISIFGSWLFMGAHALGLLLLMGPYNALLGIWEIILAGMMLKKSWLKLTGVLQILTLLLIICVTNLGELSLMNVFLSLTFLLATLVMLVTSNPR